MYWTRDTTEAKFQNNLAIYEVLGLSTTVPRRTSLFTIAYQPGTVKKVLQMKELPKMRLLGFPTLYSRRSCA